MNKPTIAIRRRLIAAMSEGLASVSDEKFNRIARAVAYLSRRMERGGSMRLIESNQLVGLGNGFSVLRDLYESEDGKRISVRKTKVMFAECRADREKQEWVFLSESEIQPITLP